MHGHAIALEPMYWDKPTQFVPERLMGMRNEVDFRGTNFSFIRFLWLLLKRNSSYLSHTACLDYYYFFFKKNLKKKNLYLVFVDLYLSYPNVFFNGNYPNVDLMFLVIN